MRVAELCRDVKPEVVVVFDLLVTESNDWHTSCIQHTSIYYSPAATISDPDNGVGMQ